MAKRLKYRRRPWTADAEHFHHRLARIGFSQRRTVLYLYGWTFALAGLAVALRFVPYSDHHGHLQVGWTIVVVALGLLAIAASVYLVYVLEMLKFTRRGDELRAQDPRPPSTRSSPRSSGGWRPGSSNMSGARPRSSTPSATDLVGRP